MIGPNKLRSIDVLSILFALSIGILPWSEKLNTISIAIVSIGTLISLYLNKKRFQLNLRQFFLAAGIFLVALAWLPFSNDLVTGAHYLERILTALIFPLLFLLNSKNNKLNFHYIYLVFLFSCLLRYFVFLTGALELELVFISDYWKEMVIQLNQLFKEKALHPSYFSMYLGFCSIICYYFFSSSSKTRNKTFWIALLFILIFINLSIGSKMPFIATLVSLIFGLLLHVANISKGRGKKRLIVALTTGIIIFGAYFYSVPNTIQQDLKNYYNYFNDQDFENAYDYNQLGTNYSIETWSKTNRIYIWKSSIGLLKSNFLLGVGTGDIKDELNHQYIIDNQKYLADKNANTHNQYLDYFIKFGIIGFLILTFLFYSYFKTSMSKHKYIYFMFLCLVFTCMITENILSRQFGIVFFFFFNSLFFCEKSEN